jgi:hypothetical protein
VSAASFDQTRQRAIINDFRTDGFNSSSVRQSFSTDQYASSCGAR